MPLSPKNGLFPTATQHFVALHNADPVCPIFQILTKDSVTVSVDAIMYYKVSNAISAISNVDDYGQSTRLLAATTLRFEFTFRIVSFDHIQSQGVPSAASPFPETCWAQKIWGISCRNASPSPP